MLSNISHFTKLIDLINQVNENKLQQTKPPPFEKKNIISTKKMIKMQSKLVNPKYTIYDIWYVIYFISYIILWYFIFYILYIQYWIYMFFFWNQYYKLYIWYIIYNLLFIISLELIITYVI